MRWKAETGVAWAGRDAVRGEAKAQSGVSKRSGPMTATDISQEHGFGGPDDRGKICFSLRVASIISGSNLVCVSESNIFSNFKEMRS
eukprot:1263187-Amorphochlora_amoeboformis.AAC.1